MHRRFFFDSTTGGKPVRYPNLRYGNPTEMAYYAMGVPLPILARRLRRDERTVRDWLAGRTRVPWWVPEILRLKHMEADLRHRQMGFGALAPRLGVVSADVIALPTAGKSFDDAVPVLDSHAPLKQFDLGQEAGNDLRSGLAALKLAGA
jgi:hypothetical protein